MIRTSLRWLLLGGALLLLLGSCQRQEQTPKEPELASEELETLAVVNSKKITLPQFQERLQGFLKDYRSFAGSDEQKLKEIKLIVINLMVEEELIRQEASRKGIQIDSKELETSYQEALNPYPQANFEELLVQENLSPAGWKEQLQLDLLVQKMMEREVLSKIAVTKREIADHYKKHRREMVMDKAVRVRNITLRTLEEAKAILRQLETGGKFMDLVRKHSISPDRASDGDLGFIEPNQLPPELEQEIFKLSKTTPLSEIVHSQDGYHIFQFLGSRAKRRLSLQEARSDIKRAFELERQDQAYQAWMERLKANAAISIDEAMLQREEAF